MKRAIRDLDKAIELEPNHSEAYMVRGVCYMNMDNKTEGAADLKRAAEMGDEEAKLLYDKYVKQGN